MCHVAMIVCGIRVPVLPAKRDEVCCILRGLLEPTRVRSGCLSSRLYQDVEDPDVLSLVQEWAGSDELERYLRSDDGRTLVAVMELATRQPEVWFDTVMTREGLEHLAMIRGVAKPAP